MSDRRCRAAERIRTTVVVALLLSWSAALAIADDAPARPAPPPGDLGQRLDDLERRNAALEKTNGDLAKRLAALEAARPATATAAGEGPFGVEAVDEAPGFTAHYGAVRATFQFLGDITYGYQNPPAPGEGHTTFDIEEFDFLVSAHAGEHFQVLTEVLIERNVESGGAEGDLNVELSRLWGSWTFNDLLYLKAGAENSPVTRWNRLYPHAAWFWASVEEPDSVLQEDGGGRLPVLQLGIEAGGRLVGDVGTLSYVGTVSNGRSRLATQDSASLRDTSDEKALDLGFGFSPFFLPKLTIGGNFHSDDIPVDPSVPGRAHPIRELIESSYLDLRLGSLDVLAELFFIQHQARLPTRHFDSGMGYVQAAYHLGSFVPYARLELIQMRRDDPFYAPADLDLGTRSAIAGLRFDPIEQVSFKIEGSVGRGERRAEDGAVSRRSFDEVLVQIAWIF